MLGLVIFTLLGLINWASHWEYFSITGYENPATWQSENINLIFKSHNNNVKGSSVNRQWRDNGKLVGIWKAHWACCVPEPEPWEWGCPWSCAQRWKHGPAPSGWEGDATLWLCSPAGGRSTGRAHLWNLLKRKCNNKKRIIIILWRTDWKSINGFKRYFVVFISKRCET